MRLELVLEPTVIHQSFSFDPRDIHIRSRLHRHQLVASDSLLKLWEKHAIQNNYFAQYQYFISSIVGYETSFKKVVVSSEKETAAEILIETANQTKCRIIVGDLELDTTNLQGIKLISLDVIKKQKNQQLTSNHLHSYYVGDHSLLFDLYETPVTFNVDKGYDSNELATFLSEFYKDSSKLIIQDAYLMNPKNELNLKTYILPYLDASQTVLEFRVSCISQGKKTCSKSDILFKFGQQYEGFKSSVIIDTPQNYHEGFIQSDNFKLNINYRLAIFGDGDNKTKGEHITVSRLD